MLLTSLALTLLLQTQAPGAAPTAPTRDEKLQAAQTVARMWWAQTDPQAPQKKMLAMSLMIIVQDIAGATPNDPPEQTEKKLQPVMAELKKRGVDANAPLEEMLNEFRTFTCKSKQSEAKANLKALYVAEESYRAEFDTYDKDFKKIGFEPRAAEPQRYRFEIVSVSKSAFKARAVGVGEMAGDEWTITNANDLVAVKDKCAPKAK